MARDVRALARQAIAYARKRDALAAMSCLEEMRKLGTPPGALEMSETVAALRAIGDRMSSRALIAEMRRRGIGPGSFVLNCTLRMMIEDRRRPDTQVILSLFPEGAGLSAYTWELLIRGCAQADDTNGALDALSRMTASGEMQPTNETLVVLLKACARKGELQRSRDVYAQLVQLNVSARNVLLDAHLQANDPDGALWLYQTILDDGSRPTRKTFAAALQALCALQRHGEALNVARRMREVRARPNAAFLARLDAALERCGVRDRAPLLLEFARLSKADDALDEYELEKLIAQGEEETVRRRTQYLAWRYSPTDVLVARVRSHVAVGDYAAAAALVDGTAIVFPTSELISQVLDVVERRGDVAASIELVSRLEDIGERFKLARWEYNRARLAAQSKFTEARPRDSVRRQWPGGQSSSRGSSATDPT